MSEPIGGSAEPTRPERVAANGFTRRLSSEQEVSWRDDPSLQMGARDELHGDATGVHGPVPGARAVRETGHGLDMTEYAHIVDGLSADRLVVVLRSGLAVLEQLSRAEAIAQGYTVVDANEKVISDLLRSGRVPALDVSAGLPLRDLRAGDSASSIDPGIIDQVRSEMSIPIRPEVVEPVLASPTTRVAEVSVDLPVGNRVAEDGRPAVRQGSPWGVQPPRVIAVPTGHELGAQPERPGWSEPASAARSDTGFPAHARREAGAPTAVPVSVPTVVLRTLDSDDDLSVPHWAVIEPVVDDEPRMAPADLLPETQLAPVRRGQDHTPSPVDPKPELVAPARPILVPPQPPSITERPSITEIPASERPLAERPVPALPVSGLPVPAVTVSELPATTWEGVPSAQVVAPEAASQLDADPSDTAVPAISVTNLERTFAGPLGPVPVLRGVNLDLAPGDLLIIRGQSGCGTSTLLACLAGLDLPDAGQVYVNGEEMGAWTEADRSRFRAASSGFIPQTHDLVDDLNTRDNVSLPLLAAGWGAVAARAEATRLLETFGLADRAFFFPSQMSHSERARTAVARALAGDPFVVWADDPTAGLDVDQAQLIVDALVAHHHRGATVVVASRDSRFVAATARVGEMADGVVRILDAPPLEWRN